MLSVKSVDLTAVSEDLVSAVLGNFLLLLSLLLVDLLDLLAVGFGLESFNLAFVFALLAAELGVGRVEGGHVFDHLLARLVQRIEGLLSSARVAPCHEVFFLNFVRIFRVLALAAKYVLSDKSTQN